MIKRSIISIFIVLSLIFFLAGAVNPIDANADKFTGHIILDKNDVAYEKVAKVDAESQLSQHGTHYMNTTDTMHYYLVNITNKDNVQNASLTDIAKKDIQANFGVKYANFYQITSIKDLSNGYDVAYIKDTNYSVVPQKTNQYLLEVITPNLASGSFNMTLTINNQPYFFDPTLSGCAIINAGGSYQLNQSITIGDGNNCFNVTVSNVIIDLNGFTISNASAVNASAVSVQGVNNFTVKNGKIVNSSQPIFINGSTNVSVVNISLVNASSQGIYIFDADKVSVINNDLNVTPIGSNYGLNLQNVTNASVKNNLVYNFGGVGIATTSGSGDNFTMINNSVSFGNNYGIYTPSSGINITNNTVFNITGGSGIFIVTLTTDLVESNEIYNNQIGIDVSTDRNSVIRGNNIHDNSLYGIRVFSSPNFTALNNNLTSNNVSIYLRNSDNVSLFNNSYVNSKIANELELSNFTLINLTTSQHGNVPMDIYFNNSCNGNIWNGDVAYVYNENTLCKNNLTVDNPNVTLSWSLNNITFNVSALQTPQTFNFNFVNFQTDAGSKNLNTSSVLTFKALTYTAKPFLMFNGNRCDHNPNLCNITSYSGGNLISQINSFSNYSTLDVVVGSCQTLNVLGDYQLNQSLTSSDGNSCINITTSHISLNLKGFSVSNASKTNRGSIFINAFTNTTIYNGILNNSYDGIFAFRSYNVNLTNLTLNSNQYGIFGTNATNLTLSSNVASNSAVSQYYFNDSSSIFFNANNSALSTSTAGYDINFSNANGTSLSGSNFYNFVTDNGNIWFDNASNMALKVMNVTQAGISPIGCNTFNGTCTLLSNNKYTVNIRTNSLTNSLSLGIYYNQSLASSSTLNVSYYNAGWVVLGRTGMTSDYIYLNNYVATDNRFLGAVAYDEQAVSNQQTGATTSTGVCDPALFEYKVINGELLCVPRNSNNVSENTNLNLSNIIDSEPVKAVTSFSKGIWAQITDDYCFDGVKKLNPNAVMPCLPAGVVILIPEFLLGLLLYIIFWRGKKADRGVKALAVILMFVVGAIVMFILSYLL